MIREAIEEDLPFMMELAAYGYGWHQSWGSKWLKDRITDPNSIILRGEHSFGVGFLFRPFYWKDPRGHILHVASRPKGLSREALRIIQRIIQWSKDKGAFEVVLGSEIGTDYAPFARLLGAEMVPNYLIKFKESEYASSISGHP